jgi:hypothetical protein
MKKILASTIALLAVVGMAASASATSLSPANATFTGTGTTTLKKGSLTLTCTANFTGHTTGGVGTIDTATFSGGTLGLCAGVSKSGTWTATGTLANAPPVDGKADITGVTVNASIFGTCGPTTVPVSITSGGLIKFDNVTLTPDCAINGTVQTSPVVTVVNP